MRPLHWPSLWLMAAWLQWWVSRLARPAAARPVDGHVATWAGPIRGLPNGVLPAGPVTGSGDFGMTLQTGNGSGCIELWLGLNSMWGMPGKAENPTNNSLGPGNTFKPTAPFPRQQSLGGLKLCVLDPEFRDAEFSASQRFADGVIETRYSTSSNVSVSTRSFMHAAEKALITEVAYSPSTGSMVSTASPEVSIESWTNTLWYNATPAAAADSTRAGWRENVLSGDTEGEGAVQYFTRVAIPGNTAERRKKQLHVAVVTQVRGGPSSSIYNRTTIWNNTAALLNHSSPNTVAIGARSTLQVGTSRRFTLVTVALSNLDLGTDFSVDPLDAAVKRVTSVSVAEAETSNQMFWQQYWDTASIALPEQPAIEQFWYVANYMLGVASRPGHNPERFAGSNFPNLWGPWNTEPFPGDPTGGCGWCSAYVTDYNAEALLFGAFSSNKLEQLQSYEQLVTAFLPAARQGAIDTARFAVDHYFTNQSLLQCVKDSSALHFPAGIAPFGQVSGGNGGSPGGDWDLRWPGLYLVMPLVWKYEYWPNITYGKKTLLPILRGIADFFHCWLQRSTRPSGDTLDDYVLVDRFDSIAEDGFWMGCAREAGPACKHWQDPIMTIAFLKRLYSTLPVMAKELNEPVEQWWTEVYTHLPEYTRANITVCRQGTTPPLPCYNNSRCPCTHATVFQMVGNGTDHQGVPLPSSQLISGYYSSWPVFPAEHLDVDSTGSDRVDAISTAGEMFATGPTSLGTTTDAPHLFISASRPSDCVLASSSKRRTVGLT